MKTIFNIEKILMHRKYGNSMIFIFFYKFIKNIFNFFVLFLYGMLLSMLINIKYISQFTAEQFIIVFVILYGLFLKKEKQYAILPYIVKIPKKTIKKHILTKELVSVYNFMVLLLIIPLLIVKKIEWSTNAFILLFINFFLIGLLINFSLRILKFYCNKYKLCYIVTIAVISAYIIILVITHHNVIEFSYLNLSYIFYSTIVLFIVISLIIPFYMYVINQEFYLIYESDFRHKSAFFAGGQSISNNIFNKLYILQLMRIRGARKFLRSILLYLVGGLLLYFSLDFKLIGVSLYLGAYTLNMVQFTIYINSDYFDALCTKPISFKSLLLNAYYTHLLITGILFLLFCIYLVIYDNQFIFPFISIYLYISGPMAFLLFSNILFAQKYDLYSVESDFSIHRTLAQKIVGFIAAATLFGVFAVIQLFSTTGCYIVIAISIIVIVSYHYWINFLCKKFMDRKYQIMKNLRK